jgi:hypothetical protein
MSSSDSESAPDTFEDDVESGRKWIHASITEQDGTMTFTNISIPPLSNEQKYCDDIKPENDKDETKRHQKVFELYEFMSVSCEIDTTDTPTVQKWYGDCFYYDPSDLQVLNKRTQYTEFFESVNEKTGKKTWYMISDVLGVNTVYGINGGIINVEFEVIGVRLSNVLDPTNKSTAFPSMKQVQIDDCEIFKSNLMYSMQRYPFSVYRFLEYTMFNTPEIFESLQISIIQHIKTWKSRSIITDAVNNLRATFTKIKFDSPYAANEVLGQLLDGYDSLVEFAHSGRFWGTSQFNFTERLNQLSETIHEQLEDMLEATFEQGKEVGKANSNEERKEQTFPILSASDIKQDIVDHADALEAEDLTPVQALEDAIAQSENVYNISTAVIVAKLTKLRGFIQMVKEDEKGEIEWSSYRDLIIPESIQGVTKFEVETKFLSPPSASKKKRKTPTQKVQNVSIRKPTQNTAKIQKQ